MSEFILIAFSSLSEQQRLYFFDFCKAASLESDQPAATNMWDDNWEEAPHTLPHVLLKTDRFSNGNGEFYVLINGETIAACGGVYLSEFNKGISLAGTRTWTAKQFRHRALIRDYIVPKQKVWSMNKGCKQVALCFNDYNKNIKNIFYRTRLGEQTGRVFQRSPEHLFFSNINELPFLVNIQYTPQWVLYEKIDATWEFDWSVLKA
jgi:hypothetical protein